jgi:hypothetical protein
MFQGIERTQHEGGLAVAERQKTTFSGGGVVESHKVVPISASIHDDLLEEDKM